jgi:type IV pilus assembly protein PilF
MVQLERLVACCSRNGATLPAARRGLALLLLAGGLAGCGPMPVPSSAGRDIVTNSDESPTHKRARVRLELAAAYYQQGKLRPALDEVKQSILADSSIPDAYNLRGLIYDALGDDDLAEASFRRALQLDSKGAGTMHNYGWFLCQRKRYDEADSMFLAALAVPQYRELSQTSLVRGVCFSRQGKLGEAEKALMRAYEIDAGNPTIAVNLADVLYRKADYERARFYVRRVNGSQDTANSESLWLAAKIEYRLGNAQGVKDYGNQLISRFPSSPEASAFEAGRFNE